MRAKFEDYSNFLCAKGKLTGYQSNPLEPIREVWEKYGHRTCYLSNDETLEVLAAIQESIRRMEGGG